MTANELFAWMEGMNPSPYTTEQKLLWLNDLEATLWTEVFLQPAGLWRGRTAAEGDMPLLLPESRRMLYAMYLWAMMDFARGEYGAYANSMALYNDNLAQLQCWYAENYAPAMTGAVWTEWAVCPFDGGEEPECIMTLPGGCAVLGAECRVVEAGDLQSVTLGSEDEAEGYLPAGIVDFSKNGPSRFLRFTEPMDRDVYAGGTGTGTVKFRLLLQPDACSRSAAGTVMSVSVYRTESGSSGGTGGAGGSGDTGGSTGGTGDTGGTEPVSHGIIWDLVNVTSSSAVTSVSDGASLVAVLTAAEGYTLGDVTVTMGGEALIGVWNADTATVTIASVTGDVIISCAGVEETVETVDTSPVIAQENYAYQSASSSSLATLSARTGMCITTPYTFASLVEQFTELGIYDESTGTITKPTSYAPRVAYYTPNTKYLANAEANGYSTSSITRYFKIAKFEGDTIVDFNNNSSYANSVEATMYICAGGFTDSARCNALAFTLSMDDAEDSYAYWTQGEYVAGITSLLPDGVRAGDIIFAGKNTPYYGMANIDGTLPGQTANTELTYDDDVAQDYAVATASILGEETATDTSTAYGISSDLAAVIDEVRTAWMLEYGGDYRKIPMILTADQHGRTNSGIWNMLAKTLSLHDVSKICNLGDTVSVEWYDEDTTHPLVSCSQLESWCESIKAIPFSKRLDVYGNHDTWYGNYEDEGNPVGTRYPANLSHLDQYFRNIYARRKNNNGWFAVRDDYFNVKYVVISGFEYEGTVTFRIGTEQMKFILDEFGRDDGYDIVVVSHVPVYYQLTTNVWPTGMTPDDVTDATVSRVAAIDTDALFNARKNKTSGTVTDSEGVEHSFDFSACTTDLLCALHGHVHKDAYNFVGAADTGLLTACFDWFDENTVHFVLVDRVNSRLNVWKLEGDALTVTNYQIPFHKSGTE